MNRGQGDIIEGFILHNVSSGLDYIGLEHHRDVSIHTGNHFASSKQAIYCPRVCVFDYITFVSHSDC